MLRKLLSTKLIIPNSLDFLPSCSSFIEHNARLIGFNADEVRAISLAMEETVSNLILYAYSPGQYDDIEIGCWQTPLGIEIIVKDKGMPLELSNNTDSEDSQPQLDDPRELGMYLIRKAVDEVIYTNRGSEGRETHLIKYITECPLEDIIPTSDESESENKIERIKTDLFVRRLKEGEAINISKAIYRIYGYNYFNEHAYYPDRIEKLNKNSNLMSVVAVTKENEFAGTCAVHRESNEDKLGELEQALVLPEYRGNHGMESMLKYILGISLEKKMQGVYAKSETSEVYAQRALRRLDTHDCAILLGFTSKLVWDKTDKAVTRESMVLSYLPLGEDKPHQIYVPEHHQAMVKAIYNNIGYERQISLPPRGKKPWHDESELDIKYYYNTSAAVIKVARLGKDIIHKLRHAKKEVKLKKFSVIYLYLSLKNPFSTVYFSQIENLDFFFAGIMPYEKYGDAIILQYLNNIDIDISTLVLYSEFAQKLADYIHSCRSKHPLRLLIDNGENEKLEFKSTMRLNLQSNKKDARMGYAILKTLSAFLNTDGGTLLVGVDDSGKILGTALENFPNDDKYLLYFSQLVQNNIGLEVSQFIHYQLVEIEARKILKVDCEPALKPVFLKIDSVENFYIRSGPASKKLPVSAAVSYINEHFQS